MWLPTHRYGPLMLLVFIFSVSIPFNAAFSEKVDQIVVTPQAPDTGIKCTACESCENPCGQQFTPPPPPPPPPPPSPQSCNCNNPLAVLAPPPPRFIYTTGPPGNFYSLEPYDWDVYSDAGMNVVMKSMILLVCGVFALLVLW